jgi:beta-glucosidase
VHIRSVANEQEYERFPINSEIEERVLREIYLKPFEMAIKSPNPPKCVMTAYNCVNGTYIDMNSLLQKTLRDEWGFKGLVMSDWGGTNSTVESVLTGCDLEMPGPPEKRGRLLLKHIAENDSTALLEAINASCLRMLGLLKDLNLLGLSREEAVQTRKQPELSSDTAEDRRLLRSVAADSIVLLKNSANMLPLLPSKLQGKKIALISPNAKHGTPGGGGSATMNPQYQTQPLEALRSMLETKGIRADFIYSPGALTHKWLPLVTSDKWSSPPYTKLEGKEQGLLELKYYSTPNFFGEVIDTQHRSSSHVDLFDSAPAFFYTDPNPHSSSLVTLHHLPPGCILSKSHQWEIRACSWMVNF